MGGPVADAKALNEALSAELHHMRKRREWTRVELAKKLDVKVNTLACWETGLRAVSIVNLVDVCRGLETDPAHVLTRAIATVNRSADTEPISLIVLEMRVLRDSLEDLAWRVLYDQRRQCTCTLAP